MPQRAMTGYIEVTGIALAENKHEMCRIIPSTDLCAV